MDGNAFFRGFSLLVDPLTVLSLFGPPQVFIRDGESVLYTPNSTGFDHLIRPTDRSVVVVPF